MQQQKSVRQKQSQQNVLSAVLAQFDIETQVNKMVMRSFDQLMKSNKQAFDFIKQSEYKFIKFEERLSKAQTYYQNIQMNINSKIEVTNNMDKRLAEFANEFWNGMKENNNELISMGKKFDQLSIEKRTLQNKVGEQEKGIKRLQGSQLLTNDKINQEISRLHEIIKQNQVKLQQRFVKETQQLVSLSSSIAQSRSLLQSKSSILTQLLQDLQIYKNDRPQIREQLSKVFEELGFRAMKTEILDMRGYADSKIVEERSKVNELWMRLDTMIKVEERDRKREEVKMMGIMKQNKKSGEQEIQRLQLKLAEQSDKQSKQLYNLQQSLTNQISVISVQSSAIKSLVQKSLPELQKKLSQSSLLLSDHAKSISANQNQLKEVFSSIQSINQTIDSIISENRQRKEEMNSLKSNSQGQGNVQQQVLVLFEKLDLVTSKVSKIQNVDILKINETMLTNHTTLQQRSLVLQQQLAKQTESLKLSLNTYVTSTTTSIQQTSTTLHSLITQSTSQLQTKISTLEQDSRSLIEQKIDSIKHQLQELDKIHEQVKEFKEVFKRQLIENEKVNESIAEKMERVMALFTKLKSDNQVKFEQLSGDLNRKTVEIKTSLSQLEEIKKYLSLTNECLTLLLATISFLKEPSTQNLSQQNAKDTSIQSMKPIKITSILEGWILQADQSQEKIKYRGQSFVFANRTKLVQMFLEYLVKQSEKIKGTILQNGRDVFMKVLENSEEAFTQRKRIGTSRRRPSELPKLHL